MKLASLKRGRDGALVVVETALALAADASAIAPTMQAALDRWSEVAPKLEALSKSLADGRAPAIPFDPAACAAPLPRAYQWLDASSYVNHVALVRQARGAMMPEAFWTDPLMYQGGSDAFLGPRDPILFADESGGIDFEAEIGVVLDDVPMAPSYEEAAKAIRLFVLINDVSLRHTLALEIKKELGFVQAKPSSAMSPVAVTPDELGSAWDGARLHLPLRSLLNGELFGRPNAGVDMIFDFPTLIMHAARTRRLSAGTIVGSGTVSNRGPDNGVGRPVGQRGAGYSCIAEVRTVETILSGEPATPFMQFGDRIVIEMRDAQERSIFGDIDQVVGRYERAHDRPEAPRAETGGPAK